MMDYSWIPELDGVSTPRRHPSRLAHRIVYTLMTVSLIGTLLLLNGCESLQASLERLDYVCIAGNLDGPFTESSGKGRGVKLPEGETLTPETIAALCE